VTGPEHYREAERLLAEAREATARGQSDYPLKPGEPTSAERYERAMKEALVHATLAVAAAALEPPLARYAPRPEPAKPDVPFIATSSRVEMGGASKDYEDPYKDYEDPEEAGRVAPAHLTQRDGEPQIPGTDSGSLMPDPLPPNRPWKHVPSTVDRDRNADTASRTGAQPPDTAPDMG
jgi:hypothetical protein